MITKSTIDEIFARIQIEEVIGEFVDLKKAGTNFKGLSPFTDEKTPSFFVSPSKGIFKCFSTGKGGNAVGFLMEYEGMNYPEALKYLADKYGIFVEEDGNPEEEQKLKDTRESLLAVTTFAQKEFHHNLLETEEGKSIGLAYFKERGFSEKTIKEFGLGYALDEGQAFYTAAKKQQFQEEFLLSTGLVKEGNNARFFDGFRDRVMFPIHNYTGRVVGFGGRTLKKDDKVPKYINSPESEIYLKNKLLYGLFFAKQAIRKEDECILVEGYTDVISLHQSEVENVVASSGTSFTEEQARLISRLTKNVTILFDGDAPGIKASLRSIEICLRFGLNPRLVLLPGEHDPDSFVKEKGNSGFKEYLKAESKDFVQFKAQVLLKDLGNDPFKRSEAVMSMVETLSIIDDRVKRSLFIQQAASLFGISEEIINSEINKKIIAAHRKSNKDSKLEIASLPEFKETKFLEKERKNEAPDDYFQEKEVMRLMLNYCDSELENEGGKAGEFMIRELEDVVFDSPIFLKMSKIFKETYSKDKPTDLNVFTQSSDTDISGMAVDMLTSPYHLSENWIKQHDILVPSLDDSVKGSIINAIFHLKSKKIFKLIHENQLKMKDATDPAAIQKHMVVHKQLNALKGELADRLGSVIL